MDGLQTMRDNIANDLSSALSVHQAMCDDGSLHEKLAELAQWCLAALK